MTRRAEKELEKIARGDRRAAVTIAAAITGLGHEPRPVGCRALVGRQGYRIRVRDYRVLYTVDDGQLLIEAFRLGPRGDVYE